MSYVLYPKKPVLIQPILKVVMQAKCLILLLLSASLVRLASNVMELRPLPVVLGNIQTQELLSALIARVDIFAQQVYTIPVLEVPTEITELVILYLLANILQMQQHRLRTVPLAPTLTKTRQIAILVLKIMSVLEELAHP